jgi:nucleoside-specific outer membrane channel protein Tsx
MKAASRVATIYAFKSFFMAGSLALLPLLAANSHAGSNWSTTNFQYHYGTEYELGDEKRTLITLEHANGWKYGDNFFFVDITNPNRTGEATGTELYAEIAPRLSFGKISGADLSLGIVSDLLLATTLETGDGFHNYLYGLGVNLTLPGFKFFEVNWYVRDEVTFGNTGQQITLAWGMPFSLGKAQFSFEGFFDYAWDLDASEDNIVTQPRLLLDVGSFWGTPGTLQAGIEYQIWRNKFGIDGIDEDFPELMVKWIF